MQNIEEYGFVLNWKLNLLLLSKMNTYLVRFTENPFLGVYFD